MGLGKIDYDQFTEFADKVHQTVEGNEFDQRIEKSLGQAADMLSSPPRQRHQLLVVHCAVAGVMILLKNKVIDS